MALTGNWIIENCSTVGTGALVLTGSLTGFTTFSTVANDTNLIYYSIEEGVNKETGVGTYNSAGNSITRTTITATLVNGTYTSNPGIGITLAGGSVVACTIIDTLVNDKESTDQKGIVNGYASLDSNVLVPEAQIPTHTGDVTGSTELTITDDVVTYAKVQNVVANNVILGNNTAVGSIVQELTAAEVRTIINVVDGADVTSTNETTHTDVLVDGDFATSGFMVTDGAGNYTIDSSTYNSYIHPNHTGDVFSSGDGITTIQTGVVTYAKLQNVVSNNVILGNNTAVGSIVQELTDTEVRAILNTWLSKTAAYTAVSCDQIAADTLTTAAFTITLPLSPSIGDIVTIIDSAAYFATNNLTVGRNLENINGAASDLVLNTDNSYTELRYLNSTYGWKSI